MNRISGPSGLPHSRACSRRPPPPRTVCMVVVCATAVISRLLVSVGSAGSSTRWRPGRIGRERRILSRRHAYPPVAGGVRAPSAPIPAARYCLDGGARERGIRRPRPRARPARACPRRRPGRQGHDRAGRRGGGHRQDPAGVRAGEAGPRRGVRGPPRPLDRPGRHGAALPAVRRGPAPPGRAPAGRRAGGGLAAARVRADAGPAHRPCRRRTGPAGARGPALGRHLDPGPGRLPRPQPPRPAGAAADDLPRRRAILGRAHAPARRRRPALGSALVLELGPLDREELAALLATHARAPLPVALTDTIAARSEGNPFFAEELLAAGDRGRELPRGLRDLLLQRVARLDPATQSLLRLAAAAGHDVGYPLLRAVAARPEPDLRESLRRAVEHGVLVAEQATGSLRFRHALLAEAVYTTILPGEREELHARLAEELARGAAAPAAELAPHWA